MALDTLYTLAWYLLCDQGHVQSQGCVLQRSFLVHPEQIFILREWACLEYYTKLPSSNEWPHEMIFICNRVWLFDPIMPSPCTSKRFCPKYLMKTSGIFKLDEEMSEPVFLANLYLNGDGLQEGWNAWNSCQSQEFDSCSSIDALLVNMCPSFQLQTTFL